MLFVKPVPVPLTEMLDVLVQPKLQWKQVMPQVDPSMKMVFLLPAVLVKVLAKT